LDVKIANQIVNNVSTLECWILIINAFVLKDSMKIQKIVKNVTLDVCFVKIIKIV
jgi:hypothetical protein